MKLSTARHGAALAAASLLLGAGVTVSAASTAPAAEATAPKLKIVQHNTDQDPARWAKVVALAESGDWDAVTVQEVCKGWKDELVAKHTDWTIAYHEQVAKADCPGGAKGNVVIRPGAGARFAEAFDVPGEDKDFGIACVAFAKGDRKVHACSTHFTVYAEKAKKVRRGEALRVQEITGKWIRGGHSVVVAGDFNALPTHTALDPIYQFPAGRSTGRFVEAEQLRLGVTGRVGRDTVERRKIDYVFFSTNRTPLSAGGTLRLTSVLTQEQKDDEVKEPHMILKATAALR